VETTGKVQFSGLTWKPLVGFQRNTGMTQLFGSQLPQSLWAKAWNVFDRSSWIDVDSPVSSWPANNNTFGEFQNLGAYSANQFSLLNDRLILVGGLRWSQAKANTVNRFNNAQSPKFETKRFTPQFGAGFKIKNDLMLYGSYSESFTAANALLQTKSIADRLAEPFLGKGYEAGIKADFLDGRISGTLSYFVNRQENYIFSYVEVSPTGQTLTTQVQSGNVVESKGVELELTYSPTDYWQIYFGASSAPTEYTKISSPDVAYLLGTAPQYTARDRANLWTRYNFRSENVRGLWIAGGVNYTGKKAEISNNPWLYLPSQKVFDLVVGYDWKTAGRNWSTKLSWKNVTDEDEIQTVRERGEPSRLIAEIGVKF
jgi:iron complex outermembrane recepter protein